jgi:hypothetical protein
MITSDHGRILKGMQDVKLMLKIYEVAREGKTLKV